jgi:hypothetical protein
MKPLARAVQRPLTEFRREACRIDCKTAKFSTHPLRCRIEGAVAHAQRHDDLLADFQQKQEAVGDDSGAAINVFAQKGRLL